MLSALLALAAGSLVVCKAVVFQGFQVSSLIVFISAHQLVSGVFMGAAHEEQASIHGAQLGL